MCGIAGLLGTDPAPPSAQARLGAMLDAIAHRGPDGRGGVVVGPACLGHVRLSILDHAGGAQPFVDDSGEVFLSFNGEIFNHEEIRRDLETRGHVFRTRSDTEALLRLYLERGEACVHALNGDFAFAIYDSRTRKLLLARDRMGVRPLYWTRTRDGLAFASEIRALLAGGFASGALDALALADIFTLWFPLAPRTAFAGVSELPPGHLLVATDAGIRVSPWWEPSYPSAEEDAADARGEGAIAEEVAALLADATRLRLRADVPVGAYLSGGLDSSIVAALAAREVGAGLRTFSVGFEAADLDETPFQQEMVARLGTAHTAILCRGADIAEDFAAIVAHAERPILRTAPAPLYRLAARVRAEGYKVVLTGEGADEVFGGYDVFKEAKIRAFCARAPGSRLRPLLFRRLYPYMPSLQAQSPAYLNAFFGMALDRLGDPLFSHLPRFSTTAKTKAFFSDDLRRAIGDYDPLAALAERLPRDYARWHPLAQAQYLEIAHLLPGYILSAQGDRVSMAHAVEGRFPFLDPRVVDAAARIPARLKLKGLREKHILKAALGHLVPASITARPKQPYRAPDAAAFFAGAAEGGIGAPVLAHLAPDAIARQGLFEPRAVEKLVRKCAGGALGAKDNMALVGILSTQILREAPALTPARPLSPRLRAASGA